MGGTFWRRLTGAVHRRPEPRPSEARTAEPDTEEQRGREAFEAWEAAAAGLRSGLITAAGQWFVDALAWPAASMARQRAPHREGPVPAVEVMSGVLERLGERPDVAALAALERADAALLDLRGWPRAATEDVERFRSSCLARIPQLGALLDIPEDPAHRQAREALERITAELTHEGIRFSPHEALASARWWPGRKELLPHAVARRVDPLGINTLDRVLMESRREPGPWYDALGRARGLYRGEGTPAVDPVAWILSALRYRVAAVRHGELWL